MSFPPFILDVLSFRDSIISTLSWALLGIRQTTSKARMKRSELVPTPGRGNSSSGLDDYNSPERRVVQFTTDLLTKQQGIVDRAGTGRGASDGGCFLPNVVTASCPGMHQVGALVHVDADASALSVFDILDDLHANVRTANTIGGGMVTVLVVVEHNVSESVRAEMCRRLFPGADYRSIDDKHDCIVQKEVTVGLTSAAGYVTIDHGNAISRTGQ